ncbi:MAG TPA: M20/M25/M40 family metallo-hydrolase [Pyrinomonadaceae bacterium]|jgi:acetylornithine deacetylase/succinyl-diaminopimelate desuccinylase-like protein|nr:M20/M25/M40 family metallo-hydrolase [Pyrinomonadaceae bacterium]
MSHVEVLRALRSFETNAGKITEEQIRICSVPASPFGEQERAEYLRQKFSELQLTETEIDAEGNCLGLLRGASLKPLVVVSAHLDTVFSKDTDFTVVKRDHKLFAPGIADDGCGLAALIALAQVIQNEQIPIEGSLLFVGTVGEEGEGNLRGVRHLLTKGRWASQVDAFLSFDGPGLDRITNRALGSRRYRVEFTGPGGHSWGDFGLPNPVHALGRAISRLAGYPAPKDPRTTFNVGRIEGGTGVNSIPSKAGMEVDLRSTADSELQRLDAFFRRAMRDAADEENGNKRAGDPLLQFKLELIGERPSGETPSDSPLVELALEATRMFGVEGRLDQSSTDSNLPISLGIPAITLGAGGASGCSHTLDEWYDPRDREKGLKRGLLVVLGMAGITRR